MKIVGIAHNASLLVVRVAFRDAESYTFGACMLQSGHGGFERCKVCWKAMTRDSCGATFKLFQVAVEPTHYPWVMMDFCAEQAEFVEEEQTASTQSTMTFQEGTLMDLQYISEEFHEVCTAASLQGGAPSVH